MTELALPNPGLPLATSGPAHRAILRLAAPTVAAMLTQSIVNDIDAFFFAHLPCPESSNAQAALLPSLIVLWLFGGSLAAVSVGTQAFTGRRFAEKRYEDAGAVAFNAVLFCVIAGIIFSVIGYLSMPSLLRLIIRTDGPREAARAYLGWRLLGVMSMAASMAFKAFFDGIGKTHVHLVAAATMNALNIVLCLLLIFGNTTLGLPRMGIEGAGLAGFASTYVGLLILVAYAIHPTYRNTFRPFSASKLDLGLMRSVVKLSIPSAVATVAVMTGFALFAAIASLLDRLHPAGFVSALCPGGDAEPVNLAATTDIVVVLKLTFTACLAFGTSTATLVSQSLGEHQPKKAENFGWVSVKLGLVIFGIVGFLELTCAKDIIAFMTHSPVVQARALFPMRLMGACTPLIAVGMILTQALFGAGNTRFVMFAELILHFTCLVPLAYLLGVRLDLGLLGLWSAGAAYIVLLAATMTIKFRLGDWKGIKI